MSISKNSVNIELDTKRHSFAHIMAAAVKQMFPEAQFGVGPVIETGCYYDFILPRTLIPEDLPLIEAKIKDLLKRNLVFKVQEMELVQAIELFEKANQPLKVELLNDLATKGTTSMSEEEKADFEVLDVVTDLDEQYLEFTSNEIADLLQYAKNEETKKIMAIVESVIVKWSENSFDLNSKVKKTYPIDLKKSPITYFHVCLYRAKSSPEKETDLLSEGGDDYKFRKDIILLLIEDPEVDKSIKEYLKKLLPIFDYALNENESYLDIILRAIKSELDNVKINKTPQITIYRLVDETTGEIVFEDLCKGPHIGSVRELTHPVSYADTPLKEGTDSGKKTSESLENNLKEGTRFEILPLLSKQSQIPTYLHELEGRAKEMRNNSTKSEVRFWCEIKNDNVLSKFDFHRQKPIGQFIVDFYCNELKLVIEIDGSSHDDKQEYDKERDDYLKSVGLTVMRFTNEEIMDGLDQVFDKIKQWGNEKIKANLGGVLNSGDVPPFRRVPAKQAGGVGFSLDKFSASYWRGDQKRDIRMQRIYALVFDTVAELSEFQKQREEAKKRDHRVLGASLKLFTISELVGAGLPLFQPKGAIVRKLLEDYLWQLQKDSHQRVYTPHITKEALYEKSGHAGKYLEDMFSVYGGTSKETFYVKPMNCPMHMQIFADNHFSYKDMPVRYFDPTTVYRDEKTGQLSGLTRVRSITQDDGHLFCRVPQIQEEFTAIVKTIREFYGSLGMTPDWVSWSVRDSQKPEKYLGDTANWDIAEEAIKQAAEANNLPYKRVEGEAAFYGPKLDFMFKDCIGREWQLSTIQCDFVQPERFDLSFTNEEGEKERPVVIHRAISGSLERFIGILIEHFAGRFPFWLAPVQVKILTINDQVLDYVEKVKNILNSVVVMKPLKYNELRYELDDRSESLGKKIREAEMLKIPVILIVGPKDVEANQVSVRTQEGEQKVSLEELGDFLKGVK